MEILTIMVVGSAMQIKCEGYKVEVNENSFLEFESKKHYENIKELEISLFDLVNEVINGSKVKVIVKIL